MTAAIEGEILMSPAATPDYGAEILARIFSAGQGGMLAQAAREILGFNLPQPDRNRVNELAAKARQGSLDSDERKELDDYERVTAMLELMQSRARLSLKRAGA
jgi:hypothetical protein